MAVKILLCMFGMTVLALVFVVGRKVGMRRGKSLTLAIQAEIRRRQERAERDALQ